ncbi:MAG: hypothetical protein CMJ58_03770 [Planctomycetaceae bacterium]|nr:hypothetical protein [Planctomycetaceae bacterium]
MNRISFCVSLAAAACIAGTAAAVTPPMPPMTSGSGDAGMKHALISLTGTTLHVHVSEPPEGPASPVEMMSGHGADYEPARFDVLEGKFFNAQHGWLADGFISLPTDRAIWIERTAATQPPGAEFRVYEAGSGMTAIPGEGMPFWTLDEIYATDGDSWQWDGVMQHDYYTGDLPGDYAMSFRVYVGDLSGAEDITYTPATATFQFHVVPEPAAWALAGLAAVGWATRRWR